MTYFPNDNSTGAARRQLTKTTSTAVNFPIYELSDEVVKIVRVAADTIHATLRKTLMGLIVIGEQLKAVRAALPHGTWLPWLSAEFGMSERTARNYIQLADAFPSLKSAIIADLPPTGMMRLAAAPPEIRDAIVKRLESGEMLTGKEIDQAIKEAKVVTAAKPAKPQVPPPIKPDSLAIELREALAERWIEQIAKVSRAIEGLPASVAQAIAADKPREDSLLTKKYLSKTGDMCWEITSMIACLTEGKHTAEIANKWIKLKPLALTGRIDEVLHIVADLHRMCNWGDDPEVEKLFSIIDRFAAAGITVKTVSSTGASDKAQ